MLFKIIFFTTILGLHSIYSHGNVYKIQTAMDHPNASGIFDELVIESSTKLKPRDKKETRDSEIPIYGKNRAQELRNYLDRIEYYMPAIRENIDKLERKFSGDHLFGQDSERYDNGPDKNFYQSFSKTTLNPNVEIPWKYRPKTFSVGNENGDDREKLNRYQEDGVDVSLYQGFDSAGKPETNWQSENDGSVESIQNFETFKNTENDDFASGFDPVSMNANPYESDRDDFDGNDKEIKNHEMGNLCEECGKPIRHYGSNKPLVININSDCSSDPNNQFINGYSLQSRGHCRPFKCNPSSQQFPKYRQWNYREMPRRYYI